MLLLPLKSCHPHLHSMRFKQDVCFCHISCQASSPHNYFLRWRCCCLCSGSSTSCSCKFAMDVPQPMTIKAFNPTGFIKNWKVKVKTICDAETPQGLLNCVLIRTSACVVEWSIVNRSYHSCKVKLVRSTVNPKFNTLTQSMAPWTGQGK